MDTTTVSVTNDLRTIRAKFVESLRLSKASISTLKLKSNDLASEISFYKNSLNRQEDVNKEQLDYVSINTYPLVRYTTIGLWSIPYFTVDRRFQKY